MTNFMAPRAPTCSSSKATSALVPHSIGAQVAVIADEDGLAYKQRPDQIIVAPRGPNTNQRSLIVPFIISYALQFALHHLAGDETERALLLLDDIARVVGDDEPSHGA